MKIGIIGCGNIAHLISKELRIQACYDILPEKCHDLSCKSCKSVDELIKKVDLIVEAASIEAVKDYSEKILSHGKNMIIMSVGALANKDFRRRLIQIAEKSGAEIYITSGAIGGVDLVRSAKAMGIDKLTLQTYKSAESLGLNISSKELIFKGKASEAIKKFPQSVNVAVLLSIIADRDIDVEVYADPSIDTNVHVIDISGGFGEAKFEIKNRPSKDNPKTSYLAALSLIEGINSLHEKIRVI